MKKGDYIVVRTYSAGVFAGTLESRKDRNTVLKNVRRIWIWEGAASLSQLAQEGTSKPERCKFPCAVKEIELTDVLERIATTKKAEGSIKGVPIWSA